MRSTQDWSFHPTHPLDVASQGCICHEMDHKAARLPAVMPAAGPVEMRVYTIISLHEGMIPYSTSKSYLSTQRPLH